MFGSTAMAARTSPQAPQMLASPHQLGLIKPYPNSAQVLGMEQPTVHYILLIFPHNQEAGLHQLQGLLGPVLGWVLKRVNLVNFFLKVDSIGIEGIYPGYEN